MERSVDRRLCGDTEITPTGAGIVSAPTPHGGIVSDDTDYDINWREVSDMTKFSNWFKSNPVRNLGYVVAGIIVLALIGRVLFY